MEEQGGTVHGGEQAAVARPDFGGVAASAMRRIMQAEARQDAIWPIDPEIQFDELEFEFEPDDKILWAYQTHGYKPNVTPELIRDIGRAQQAIRDAFAAAPDAPPLRTIVWGSRTPNIFNLGGDLGLFVELIEARDEAGLTRYAHSCIDIAHPYIHNLDLPILTISLVQGDALGGGFEAAMLSDVIVAERGVQFGLPEILFGLFPGMGAYSLLARRIGAAEAERMIFSGRLFRAEELHEMRVVDVLADAGQGETAVYDHIKENERRLKAHRALYKVRQRFNPVTREELIDVADLWVETALELPESEVRKMARLARAQQKRLARRMNGTAAAEPKATAEPAPEPTAREVRDNVTPLRPRTEVAAEPPRFASTNRVYERILEGVAMHRAAGVQQPSVQRLLRDGMDRDQYLRFLGELYHVVLNFCPVMEAALARCDEDPGRAPLAAHLRHSIEEEAGHESLVLADIAALGGDAGAVAASKPSVAIQALLGYNDHVARQGNPWGVLGMVYALEEIAANFASRVARRTASQLGLGGSAGFAFLYSHGEMDQEHLEEFKRLVAGLESKTDQDAIIDAARVNYALFGALFRED